MELRYNLPLPRSHERRPGTAREPLERLDDKPGPVARPWVMTDRELYAWVFLREVDGLD